LRFGFFPFFLAAKPPEKNLRMISHGISGRAFLGVKLGTPATSLKD
jgi:hypothetical protein